NSELGRPAATVAASSARDQLVRDRPADERGADAQVNLGRDGQGTVADVVLPGAEDQRSTERLRERISRLDSVPVIVDAVANRPVREVRVARVDAIDALVEPQS